VAGVRVYPNEKVRRVVAAIPPGHKHVRLVIELEDQTIVLQEAAAAAIARAYVDVVTHPTRRAVELVGVRVSKRAPARVCPRFSAPSGPPVTAPAGPRGR